MTIGEAPARFYLYSSFEGRNSRTPLFLAMISEDVEAARRPGESLLVKPFTFNSTSTPPTILNQVAIDPLTRRPRPYGLLPVFLSRFLTQLSGVAACYGTSCHRPYHALRKEELKL
jgi:hypothetical protein